MIKAVLFDLDGTLVNSLYDLATSTNYALEKMGFPTHETDKYRYFVGDGMQKLIERVLPENKRTDEIHKECYNIFIGHYREHYVDKTCAYEGINELLHALKAKGIKTAVVSNKQHDMAVTVVNKLFSEDAFDFVSGKQENYPAKPDPTLILKIMSDLDVEPHECVMVGDSGMDMAVGVNAGCTAVGVLWGFRTEQELRENGSDYIADCPQQILNIIEALK